MTIVANGTSLMVTSRRCFIMFLIVILFTVISPVVSSPPDFTDGDYNCYSNQRCPFKGYDDGVKVFILSSAANMEECLELCDKYSTSLKCAGVEVDVSIGEVTGKCKGRVVGTCGPTSHNWEKVDKDEHGGTVTTCINTKTYNSSTSIEELIALKQTCEESEGIFLWEATTWGNIDSLRSTNVFRYNQSVYNDGDEGDQGEIHVGCTAKFDYTFTIVCVILFSINFCGFCLLVGSGALEDDTADLFGGVCCCSTVGLIIICSVHFSGGCRRGTSGSNRVCTECAVGRFGGKIADSQLDRLTKVCDACPSGFYQNFEGMGICWPCETGKFQDGPGLHQCKSCSNGSFTGEVGLSICSVCTSGMYAKTPTSKSCTLCAPGKFYSGSHNQQYDCDACSAGRYNPGLGSSKCLECEHGKLSSSSGATACAFCPAGYKANAGSSSGQSSCTICPSGSYSDGAGHINCKLCPVGLYNSRDGQKSISNCLQCTAGSFSNSKGMSSCEACPSGTITGAEGSASCIACNSPKYQDGTRQTSCKTCATCAIDFVSVQPCGGPSAGRCDSCGINCGQCKSPDGCVGLTTEECDEKNRIQCLRSGCINSAYFHESRCYETCHDFGLFMHNDIENATTGGTCRARLGQRAVFTLVYETASAMDLGLREIVNKVGMEDLAKIISSNSGIADTGAGVTGMESPQFSTGSLQSRRLGRILNSETELTMDYWVSVEVIDATSVTSLQSNLNAWIFESPSSIVNGVKERSGASSVVAKFEESIPVTAGICSKKYRFDNETQECQKCEDHCDVCTSEIDVCLVCSGEDYALSKEKCYTKCPRGYERKFLQLTENESGWKCELWDGVPLAVGLSLFFVFTVVILVWKKKEVKELCGACSNRVTAINASTKLHADEAKRKRERAKSLDDKGLVLTPEERKQVEKFYKDKGKLDQEEGKQNEKFNPKNLSFANSSDALNFAKFLGMSEEYLNKVQSDGEEMMKQEILRLENRENRKSTDPEWWYAKAGDPGDAKAPRGKAPLAPCPDAKKNESEVLYHWRYVVEEKSSEHLYKNGMRDKGRKGMNLSDFMKCPEVKDAEGLERAHVIALRLYTTAIYTYINEPLRFQEHYRKVSGAEPRHPLAAVVWFIFKGLKILRMNSDIGEGSTILWRGMKNAKVADEFLKSGGSNCEKAPMSTTKDLKVALAYSKGGGVIFKIEVPSKLQMGGDITFLSAFPEEKEVLYPPLTQLNLTKSGYAGNKKVNQEKIFINGDSEGAAFIIVFLITPDQSSSDGSVSSPSRRKNSLEGKTLEVGEKSVFAERRPTRTQSLPRPSRTQSQPVRSSFSQVVPAFEHTMEPIVSRHSEVPIAAVVPMSSPLDHYTQQLEKAKQLWDDGTIDEDEFKEMKQEAKDEKARRLNEIRR